MLRIQIKGPKVDYDITLVSKFTVLSRRCGTRETYLYDIVKSRELSKLHSISVSDDDYQIITNKEAYRIYYSGQHVHGCWVYLVGEYDDYDNILRHWVEESERTYFVLATRRIVIPQAEYGLRDVYEFVTVDGVNTLLPKLSGRI